MKMILMSKPFYLESSTYLRFLVTFSTSNILLTLTVVQQSSLDQLSLASILRLNSPGLLSHSEQPSVLLPQIFRRFIRIPYC